MKQRLLSQLAHVEVLTPTPQASLDFYTQVLGMEVSGQRGQSVYLRGWSEWFHHSLQLTEGSAPALGHIGWRAEGSEQLALAVSRLEGSDRGEGWHEDELGHGPAYRYRSPRGNHLHELFWEVERYEAPTELASTYPNRPQRYEGRGVGVRYLDHVTINSPDLWGDVEWYREALGHRLMEYTTPDDAPEVVVFAMLSVCERGHDMGIVPDAPTNSGRLNHIAFWLDQREDLRKAADYLLEHGVAIEFGPGRHGMSEIDYLYFREPSGLRVELNSGSYRNYEPDWEPKRWTASQGSNVFFRNLAMPESMMESFPPAEAALPREEILRSGHFT
jgi:catechol 2,3-dioxygenase